MIRRASLLRPVILAGALICLAVEGRAADLDVRPYLSGPLRYQPAEVAPPDEDPPDEGNTLEVEHSAARPAVIRPPAPAVQVSPSISAEAPSELATLKDQIGALAAELLLPLTPRVVEVPAESKPLPLKPVPVLPVSSHDLQPIVQQVRVQAAPPESTGWLRTLGLSLVVLLCGAVGWLAVPIVRDLDGLLRVDLEGDQSGADTPAEAAGDLQDDALSPEMSAADIRRETDVLRALKESLDAELASARATLKNERARARRHQNGKDRT